MLDFNQPIDHTMGGATESFRSGEFQVEQISVGGDFHYQNVRGRILTMNGLFATTTPRNDASAGVGQWDLRNAYKYVSEAWGGYHLDVAHGLNVDAGIFVSYIGLFSYYNFDNWTYQPSFVSSNTPWFFNGLRIQYFPTQKLKIEPWIINGWQSYGKFNGHRGLGGQILWIPKDWLRLVFNNYGNGTDTLGNPGRSRLHTDDSIEVRYYNKPENTGLSKMAFSFTADAGCEYGGGVTCHGGKDGPKQAFLGWMAYDRIVVPQGSVSCDDRRRPDEQPWPLSDAAPAHQRRGCHLRFTLLHGKPWGQVSHVGCQHQSPIYAQTVHHLVAGGRLSSRGCAVLVGPRRNYSSWRQYRRAQQYVCAAGGSAGTNDLATALFELRGTGQCLVPGFAQGPGHRQRRRHGQILVALLCESIYGAAVRAKARPLLRS